MQQLSFLPGEMTPGERSLIQRALKTLDRHLHEPGVAFTSTRAAREWLILNMAGLEREEFRVLYLNNQNQLIAGETLFTGTIAGYDYTTHRYLLLELLQMGIHAQILRTASENAAKSATGWLFVARPSPRYIARDPVIADFVRSMRL